MGDKKQEKSKNLNKRLMKAVKASNSLFEKSLDPKVLEKHRKKVERAGKLVTSRKKITIKRFKIGDIRCEMIRPKDKYDRKTTVLYAHGGAYISGGLCYSRVLASKMAVAMGCTVFTFEYRLAPENPYPAAFDDGMAVWKFLTKSRFKPERVMIAGDSAGGNLALVITQKLKQNGEAMPGGLVLFSPWTDMTLSGGSYEEKESVDPIFTKQFVKEAADAYIALPGEAADPKFSPVFGSFEGFPPTLIMVGNNEILLDDSIKLQENMIRDGVRAELDIEKDGWHVYQLAPLPIAKKAIKRAAEFVSNVIGL